MSFGIMKAPPFAFVFSLMSLAVFCQELPEAPGDLKYEFLGSSGLKLSWQDNSHDEEGFRIERKTDKGGWMLIGSVPANTCTFESRILLQI